MSATTARSSAASALSQEKLPIREVSLTYYLDGQQRILRFNTVDPTFRQTIQVLRELSKPFRLIYIWSTMNDIDDMMSEEWMDEFERNFSVLRTACNNEPTVDSSSNTDKQPQQQSKTETTHTNQN